MISYLSGGLCFHCVPLPPALPHVPPPPTLGCVAFGKGKAGRSPGKAGTSRTAAGAGESDIRGFCSFHQSYSVFHCCLLQTPYLPLARDPSSQLHSFWPLAPAVSRLLFWLGQPLPFPPSPFSLPAACLTCFGHELYVTQTPTKSLAHWGLFSGAVVIITSEGHCANILTSLYRDIQRCFIRL